MSFQGKYILVAIDGTDSAEWRNATGSNSHTHRFYSDFDTKGGSKAYWDGPGIRSGGTVFGAGSDAILESVVAWVNTKITSVLGLSTPASNNARTMTSRPSENLSGPSFYMNLNRRFVRRTSREKRLIRDYISNRLRICLVGHSRGGMIAICAAPRLPLPVYFMGLYDAVDMHPTLDGDRIHNADIIYHAIRHEIMDSRSSWGNAGISSSSPNYHRRHFRTSHGGLGGSPELHPGGVTSDFACSIDTTSAHIMSYLGENLGQMCTDESIAADTWIRQGARNAGISV